MTSIQPTGDHIVIEAIEQPEKKEGIIIPEKFKKNEHECRVVAVGPGRLGFNDTRLPMEVKVGDIILAHRNNGVEVVVDGKTYRIIQSDSVMAVLKSEEVLKRETQELMKQCQQMRVEHGESP